MNLPHVCTVIVRSAGTPGALGSPTYTWSTFATPRCRFYHVKPSPASIAVSGETVRKVPMAMLPIAVSPQEYRITTDVSGFAGTYEIASVTPRPDGSGNVHHYEAELQGVTA